MLIQSWWQKARAWSHQVGRPAGTSQLLSSACQDDLSSTRQILSSTRQVLSGTRQVLSSTRQILSGTCQDLSSTRHVAIIRHPWSLIQNLSRLIRHPSNIIQHLSRLIQHPSSIQHPSKHLRSTGGSICCYCWKMGGQQPVFLGLVRSMQLSCDLTITEGPCSSIYVMYKKQNVPPTPSSWYHPRQ